MKTNRRELWIIVALTLIGTALRITDLTGRSMWVDEGITLTRIFDSWQNMFKNVVILHGIFTVDLHPWFYFALTKVWGDIAGNSEFALKLIPAFSSILLIPATYALARRMSTWPVALVASLLALTSPAYQWYGHELRMYPLVALLAIVTNYLVYRGVQSRNVNLVAWVLWVGVTIISVLTHYALAVMIGFQLLFVAIVILYNRQRVSPRTMIAVGGILALLIVAVFFTGLGADIYQRIGQVLRGLSNVDPASLRVDDIVTNVVNTMLFGMNSSDPTYGPFIWFVVAVCVAGLLIPLRTPGEHDGSRSTLRQRLFIALMSFPVMLFVGLLSLTFDHEPSFRYSIQVVPVLHILLAQVFVTALAYRAYRPSVVLTTPIATIFRAWRPAVRTVSKSLAKSLAKGVGIVALVSVFAAQMFGLAFTFLHTPSWQDDWRGMAQYIRNYWQPGDVIFITLLVPEDTLRLYLKDLPVRVLPIEGIGDDDAQRAKHLGGYKRIWYASAGDAAPIGYMGSGRYLLSLDRRRLIYFPSQTNVLGLSLYDIESSIVDRPSATAHTIPHDGAASANPDIAAYELQPGNPYNEHPNIRLTLYWRRPDAMNKPSDYSLTVRFKDSTQRDWADWFMPAGLETAPREWTGNQLFRADYIVPLQLGLPRQPYQLNLTMGVGEKAEPVYTTVLQLDQSQVDCCVRIARWFAAGSAASKEATLWQADDAAVSAVEFPATIYPGEILPVVLTWKLNAPEASDWQTIISLDGLLGGNVAQAAGPTGADSSPLVSWPVGEPVRSLHALQLPNTVQPGYYRLSVSRSFADGRPSDGFLLGIVHVQDYPLTPMRAVVQHPVSGSVGSAGELTLLGYSLQQPFVRGVTLRFELCWRVESQPKGDGVLFLHLVGPDGQKVAQDDNPPEQGARSTLTYRAGEGINQIHRLVIPEDAPGGTYTLYAGVYDRTTLTRWPAQQNGTQARDDLLYLGTITLPDLPQYNYHNYVPIVVQGH